MKEGYGYYVIVEYNEPQLVGSQMISTEVFRVETNVEVSVIEYAEKIKNKSYVQSVVIAKSAYEF